MALPIPVPLLLLIAVGILAGTGALLTRRDATTQSPPAKRPLPASPGLARLAGHRLWRAATQGIGLVALLALIVLIVMGPAAADRNPVPRLVLIVLWGGIVPLSLFLGPFYRTVNPLRPLAAGIRHLAAIEPRPVPQDVGRWPAAVVAALITVASQTALDAPVAVSVGVLVYVMVQALLGAVYGPSWFTRGDALEVLSDVVGSVAIVGRGLDGAIGLRDPVVAAVRMSTTAGTIGFVGVVMGISWLESVEDVVSMDSIVVLLGATAISCVVATGFLQVGAIREFLTPALLPLAAAYGLQLFTVPLLLDGQIGLSQLSDPFGRSETLPAGVAAGARLPVHEAWLALALYGSFVGLHMLSLAIAHRASLSRFDLRGARAIQFPMRSVLVGSLLIGLWLPTLGG